MNMPKTTRHSPILKQSEITNLLGTVACPKTEVESFQEAPPEVREIYMNFLDFANTVSKEFENKGIVLRLNNLTRVETEDYLRGEARMTFNKYFIAEANEKKGIIILDYVTNELVQKNFYTEMVGKELYKSIRKNLAKCFNSEIKSFKECKKFKYKSQKEFINKLEKKSIQNTQ